MTSMILPRGTSALALLLCACGSGDPVRSEATATKTSSEAVQGRKAPADWGSAMLSLVPDRVDDRAATLADVTDAFSACTVDQPGGRSGSCPVERLVPSAPVSFKQLRYKLLAGDAGVRAIRFVACCGNNLPDPLAGQDVIRREKFCPDLTLVASQSARVYRISSPGKRDFVTAGRASGAGDSNLEAVTHTILLEPVEDGSECDALKSAEMEFGGSVATSPSEPLIQKADGLRMIEP